MVVHTVGKYHWRVDRDGVVGIFHFEKKNEPCTYPYTVKPQKQAQRVYHRFQFYATIGGFSSEENWFSAAVNHTIYGASTKLLLLVLQTCKVKNIGHRPLTTDIA